MGALPGGEGGGAMIEVEALRKHFGPTRAVDGIDFSVSPGEVVGFLGPNGAGKSTTIRILTCYLPPTAGRVRVAGKDILTESLAVRAAVGYLPENVPLYPEMRVEEFLRFRASLKGIPRRDLSRRVGQAMERCGVVEVRRKPIGHVSRGYRQRVGLAEALVAVPPILILDEPTSGLDPNQRRKVKELVQELALQHTILFSSHILAEVEQVCTRVLVIHKGRIVGQGTREELVESLGGGRRLVVEADGRAGELLAMMENLEGCGRPMLMESEDAFARAEAPLERGADPRVSVFLWAREQGRLLRELAIQSPSLEEIFARLTASEETVVGESHEAREEAR